MVTFSIDSRVRLVGVKSAKKVTRGGGGGGGDEEMRHGAERNEVRESVEGVTLGKLFARGPFSYVQDK